MSSLRFNRPVHRCQAIRIAGRFDSRTRRVLPGRSVYYKNVQIDVDDGAFTGTASFIVPTLRKPLPSSPANTGDQEAAPSR